MKLKLMLLSIITFNLFYLTATDIIQKDNSNPNFTNNIKVKAFDKYNGDFYIGINGNESNYVISKAGRNDQVFTALGTLITTLPINLMDIISNGAETEYIALQNQADPLNLKVIAPKESIPTTILTESSGTGNNNIVDAAGNAALGLSGEAYRLIEGTDINYVFLRVPGSGTAYLQNSGILGYEITDSPALTRRGEPTNNYAARLDNQKGTAGSGSFLRDGSSGVVYTDAPVVNDMYWDSKLKTLFIAGSIYSTNLRSSFVNNYHMAISKIKLDENGKLIISDIIPIGVNATATNNEAIFASNTNSAGTTNDTRDPKILKIRTMHTSTGRVYLIVNGSTGNDDEVGNKILALQYNTDAELFPDTSETNGLICQNDNAKKQLINNFTISGNAFLGQALDGGHTESLTVGRENAPWEANYPASDIQVLGDTVYVSFSATSRNDKNNPGVWASQALFDKDGVIIGWTKWERVFPDPEESIDERKQKVHFFSVDTKNNKIWKITEGNEDDKITSVERTTWVTDPCSLENNPLVKVLKNDFSDLCTGGCTSVLDLPAKTPGISDLDSNKSNSFALFGGYEKVAFVRTAYGDMNDVVVDFSDPENYLLTTLKDSGTVRALGLSRNKDDSTKGYFIAGTDTGLWFYIDKVNGEGFNGNNGLTNLTQDPFDGTFEWKQFSTEIISGPVRAIESDGSAIYVIEQDVTNKCKIISKLWKIEIENDISNMESNTTLIAQSDLDGLEKNIVFTGIKLITNLTGETQEHLGILSSNLGVFQSNKPLYDFNEAGNNSGNWSVVEDTRAYHSIYSPKRVPTELFPDGDGFNSNIFANAFADDVCQRKYFQNSNLHQFSSNVDGQDNPEIAIENTKTEDNESILYTNRTITSNDRLEYIDRVLNFWTDGGRRFFVTFNPEKNSCSDICNEPNMISTLPFDAAEWNMNAPYQDDATTGKRVFWIENISGIGAILAGTTFGVIALQ